MKICVTIFLPALIVALLAFLFQASGLDVLATLVTVSLISAVLATLIHGTTKCFVIGED